MRHILLLSCFQASPMTKGAFCECFGVPESDDGATDGYLLENVATKDVQWQPKDQVDRTSTVLPEDFADLPVPDRAWVAERAMHAQRIVELEAQLAERRPHYEANGTLDVFAVTFIEPHLSMLRVLVEEIDKAIRCID